jgi:hypothetical protein
MKAICTLIACACLLGLAVMPAQALTARTLTVNLDTSGNAQIDFQYDLTFAEQAAIFFNIANPAQELSNALESNLNEPVTVTKADSSSADVTIPGFASTSLDNGTETITSPSFSFVNAQNQVRQQWWAGINSVDMTPGMTTITFPDGYQSVYYNQISIPSVTHRIG